MLADLAVHDAPGFEKLVGVASAQLNNN
jgi:ribosomal protein L20